MTTETSPATFEVGKIYRAPRPINADHAYLVTKVTRSERRTRSGLRVPNDWVTLKAGFVRDGEFHPYDHHEKPIRRKILSNRYNREVDEWCYAEAEVDGGRWGSWIKADAEVKEESR